MAITNFGTPFNQHQAQRYNLRNRPSKLAKSELRSWRFEQSEGVRPAAYYGVNRYLPVQFEDINTEDWVVIPKGRIVAAMSTEDSTISGLLTPSGAGSVKLGFEAPELGTSILTTTIDDGFFGYDMHINGLLVPANGGIAVSGYYTADDVTAETITTSGAIAAAGNRFVLPRNCPIGVVFHDWYQDIRGKYLNYTMHPDGGHVLTDWFVEVPYVKVETHATYSGVDPEYTQAYANLVKWRDINSKFTYLSVDGNNSHIMRNGMFVMSDFLGNYKMQYGSESQYDCIKTVQTVGKIIEIDNRFPKDSLEDVQTYPRSGMPGTQTAGMPKFLFDFVYDCIRIGMGTAPTVEGVYDAIRSGTFGVVRIQLLVS